MATSARHPGRRPPGRYSTVGLHLWLLGAACSGTIKSSHDPARAPGGQGAGGAANPDTPPFNAALSDRAAYGPTGPRRLSRAEYQATVRDLFGVDLGADLELLPPDSSNPFDNDFTQQLGSAAWTEGAKALADRVAAKVLGDARLRMRVIGCTVATPDDTVCLRAFVTALGRRVLRRPLGADEVDRTVAAAKTVAIAQKNGDAGLSVVMRALLQDLEFLYRIEVGEPVPDDPRTRRLTSHELATRLSFLLLGTTPDDSLLALADADQLRTPTQLRAAAVILLEDPRATATAQRFHAQWLGYEQLPHAPVLAAALHRETDALLAKVLFADKRSWLDLFTARETYVDDALAVHYNLPKPGGPAWVNYGDSGRRGILSHGSVLSNGAKFGDTSPVARGLFVLRRLLCQEVGSPPPELQVDTDSAPKSVGGNDCKQDRYAMHREGGCAGCHNLIDGIGFGLERYDPAGAYRTTEPGRPGCAISGAGELVGVGEFNGPAELASQLMDSGRLEACFLTQLFQSAAGRPPGAADAGARDALAERFAGNGRRFDQLLLDFVSVDAFSHRLAE